MSLVFENRPYVDLGSLPNECDDLTFNGNVPVLMGETRAVGRVVLPQGGPESKVFSALPFKKFLRDDDEPVVIVLPGDWSKVLIDDWEGFHGHTVIFERLYPHEIPAAEFEFNVLGEGELEFRRRIGRLAYRGCRADCDAQEEERSCRCFEFKYSWGPREYEYYD